MSSMQINSGGTPPAQQSYYTEKTAPKTEAVSPASQTETTQQTVRPATIFSASTEKDKGLMDRMKEAQEKAEELKKKLERLKVRKQNYGDAPMTAYARLARARTQADVSAAAGYARRCIAQFQTALRQDEENAPRIQAAINQLQKAVRRAGKKKRDLQNESLLESKRKRSAEQKDRKKAVRLRHELKRRQAARLVREHGYLREAEVDNRMQSYLAMSRAELRAQAQALGEATGLSPEAAVQSYTSAALAADAAPVPAAAPEVSLDIQA